MAGGQERALRSRIKTVQSTKKITKAMELIAASRIVKAQQRVHAARPYSDQILNVLHHLSAGGAASVNPLLQARDESAVQTVQYVVIAGDRGLCGGYNSFVIRAAEAAMRAERSAGRGIVLVTVGKKAEAYFRFRKWDIAAAINGVIDRPTYEDARRIAAEVLPHYEYEPDPTEILDALLPRYVEARLFGALLEASASFFASQQRAMASASDNADELITKLTRMRNRVRQDAITTEIMEIVGGAEALAAQK
jgi:F-type H+-transporting ATPase subunit gamma